MRHIISINEILDTPRVDDEVCELLASAEAFYDDAQSQVAVELEAGLRPRDSRTVLNQTVAEWPARKETVKESVPRMEARLAAREIFNRWVRKLREQAHQPSTP
jgi:hypothetical protein